jgi:hypothetical protein
MTHDSGVVRVTNQWSGVRSLTTFRTVTTAENIRRLGPNPRHHHEQAGITNSETEFPQHLFRNRVPSAFVLKPPLKSLGASLWIRRIPYFLTEHRQRREKMQIWRIW